MNFYVGTYECKIDAKGRVSIPVALRRQLPCSQGFIIKRSLFETCLEIWSMEDWQAMLEKMYRSGNEFSKNELLLNRRFMAGLKEIDIDPNGRFLITKDLIDFAKIDKDIVLSSRGKVIEVWDKSLYENMLNDPSVDIELLAEKVMGGLNNGNKE